MASEETTTRYQFTAKEIAVKLGIKGKINIFATPTKGQPVESKEDVNKKVLVITTVKVKDGGKR